MEVKYIIKMDCFDIPDEYMRTIREGCSWGGVYERSTMDNDAMEVFDSEEEALAALKSYKASVFRFYDHNVPWWDITEYFVQRCELDEDGEEVDFDPPLEYAEMKFSVIERPGYKTLVSYDNFEDALNYYDMLDDQQDYDEDEDEDDDEKGYYIECNGHLVYGYIM